LAIHSSISSIGNSDATAAPVAAVAAAPHDTWRTEMKCTFPGLTATLDVLVVVVVAQQLFSSRPLTSAIQV